MKIGIDIRVLSEVNRTGIQVYTECLVDHLLPRLVDHEVVLLSSGRNSLRVSSEWLAHSHVRHVHLGTSNRVLAVGQRVFKYPKLDEYLGGLNVFLSPHFLPIALSRKCKWVLVFHDLSFIRFPELLTFRQRLWHDWQVQPRLDAQRADRIITVSTSTAGDLVSLFGISPEKISVVYPGIDKSFVRLSDKSLSEFRVKRRLPQDFILCLGTLNDRKNIGSVVRAFEQKAAEPGRQNLHLVIAGDTAGVASTVSITRGMTNRIVILNYIKNEERPYLYGLARGLVYPSLFEGFGFPPLEALACGTPVIISNRSALPEVTGQWVLQVNPESVQEIYAAISGLFDSRIRIDSSIINELKMKYSWGLAVEQINKLIINL